MITQNEIKEKAREKGVPVSTIERDYTQNWLLKFISPIDMVLKGGTGIRKVYIGDYRFSDDLDFTLLETVNKEELKALIKESVKKAKEESGINFNDEIRFQENENGFEITVYFQIMQRGEDRTGIKIDITGHRNEKILLPLNTSEIIHPYSDELKAKIKVYSLEEIMTEKVRSLFQRTRPRDLYDVWFLWDKVNKRKVLDIFPEKCKFKDVKINIEDFESRKDDFKNAWENSLTHQLKNLPDFDKVFLEVLKELKNILGGYNKIISGYNDRGEKMSEVKVTLKTLTPLWTGDAWGNNSEIRPSSIMGSLRFWFYLYYKSYNIRTENLDGNGIPSDNLNEYVKLFNKKNNTNKTFDDLLKKELLNLNDKNDKEDVENAVKKVLDKIGLPLISQIFGCTGWKSQIVIKDIKAKDFKLKKSEIDFSFLYNKINTRAQNSKFWSDKLLFNRDEILFFKNIEFDLEVKKVYLEEIKRFFKFYEDKIILVGGKKSFGFGFCKISSDQNLSHISLPSLGNKNILFCGEKITIDNLPTNKKVLGFNFKHYQRLKEQKRFREENFGKQGKASNFFFSAYLPDICSDIYIIGFKDKNNENVFDKLMEKYKKFNCKVKE